MTRPIEFRAQRADTGEFVYGDLVKNGWRCFIIEHFSISKGKIVSSIQHEVLPETVGQFTGLIDRNGKKIFEGDKLHRMMGVIWIVSFDKHQWRAISQTDSGLYFNANEFNEFEVIGTIHDKPEKP